ncbi:hypothetical protein ANCCAN_24200, partial [Ancylostoma caninum]
MQMSRLEGPHICTRESTKKWPAEGKSLRSEKRCQRFREANKCVDRRTDSKACDSSLSGKSSLLSMEDVLEAVNSSLWTLAKGVGLEQELDKNDVTVFASPGNEDKVSDAKSYVLNRIVPGKYRPYEWTDG